MQLLLHALLLEALLLLHALRLKVLLRLGDLLLSVLLLSLLNSAVTTDARCETGRRISLFEEYVLLHHGLTAGHETRRFDNAAADV